MYVDKVDTKLMKENAKFLKLDEKYKKLELKFNEAKEIIVKEQTDKQILEMKIANAARNGGGESNARGGRERGNSCSNINRYCQYLSILTFKLLLSTFRPI